MSAKLKSYNHRWSRNRMQWGCMGRFICSRSIAEFRDGNPKLYQKFYGEIDQ